MAEEGKKISFGFAKSIKKTALKIPVPQEEKKVDYVECLDEKGIKVIGEEKIKEEPLIIPLLGSRTWHDRIVNKIDADIFEPKTVKEEAPDDSDSKQEEKPKLSNGNTLQENIVIKTEPVENNDDKVVTLEEQAAKEIVEDLSSKEKREKKANDFTLPLVEDQSLRGREQSTLEDYEKIPVDAFGLAMLRGMGWQPGKGIGKNEKIVSAVLPELRPKGMGLGADKVTLQKKNTDSKKPEEELKIEKGTFVKIIAGKQSNNYGQIEGFDDDAGRLIIKLALGGNTISVSEFMVQAVTKSEYSKNSKVLNAKKYEEYKEKGSKDIKQKPDKKRNSESSDRSNDSDLDGESSDDEKMKKKSKHERADDKKLKSRKRRSESGNDSDSDSGKRRRRSRSSSNGSYKSKKSKKSKKHKKRDNSAERSSKKHKKRDKEREKTRDRKSRDYTDRRKHKKHRRSRSRSSSKR